MLNMDEFYTRIINENLNIIKGIVKSAIYSDNLADIEDCVQNVIIAALQKHDLHEHPNIAGWLFVTSKNITMQFNHEYLRREKFLDIDELQVSSDCFVEQLIEDMEFERLKEQECLKKVFKSFSMSEKQFFRLRYIEKLSNSKISNITGKSEVAVRVRYSRLKEKIKKIIKNM